MAHHGVEPASVWASRRLNTAGSDLLVCPGNRRPSAPAAHGGAISLYRAPWLSPRPLRQFGHLLLKYRAP
jgi:hypothetical protein